MSPADRLAQSVEVVGSVAGRREADRMGLGIAAGVVGAAVVVWVGAMFGGVQVSRWWSPQPELAMHKKLAASTPASVLDVKLAASGHEIFERTCSTCHGSSGLGKAGLGKDLVHSDFVVNQGDSALAGFIAAGRAATDPANTTKMPMPPKGGNAALTDDDLAKVVVFVRGLQDPRRMPDLPPLPPPAPVVVAAPSKDEKAAALAAAGGDAELAEFIAAGAKVYASSCAACHGPAGKGLQGLGKDLTASEFAIKTDDDALLAFIKRGRAPGEPGNTTGVAMPPKGGNPALNDDNILDVIAYLRSIQPAKPRAQGGQPPK